MNIRKSFILNDCGMHLLYETFQNINNDHFQKRSAFEFSYSEALETSSKYFNTS